MLPLDGLHIQVLGSQKAEICPSWVGILKPEFDNDLLLCQSQND